MVEVGEGEDRVICILEFLLNNNQTEAELLKDAINALHDFMFCFDVISSSCSLSGEACGKIMSVQKESLLRLCNPQISQALLLWTFRDVSMLSVCCPPSFASVLETCQFNDFFLLCLGLIDIICVKMDKSIGSAKDVKGDCTEGYLKERRAEGAVPNGAAAGGTAEAAAEEE
ncbi:uncharacterized protein MONOS_8524 [Monocercomonoides exilis]|uniref:uncharacterized protein n=1 Tax=Monocercomonoides exilis TaxID=2049356 RepID=UPI00355A0041|nr:hypothetical protein MONOS_8524 [Monocercomonoides exilis]|eukprot:MONOS_8524.1-p1 / transcript=MONOS_8524.1 / gene=MONOS_8524 / organism=Monocercomonoides_exilis_PA203 / gene_product=unspecified product / transcript_product=unspecified product / location=Mono_scaffold00324:6425-7046(+) / protein_length=172 / sequence_SO=supercontig / SO=protein_coding / is_pseudo=false